MFVAVTGRTPGDVVGAGPDESGILPIEEAGIIGSEAGAALFAPEAGAGGALLADAGGAAGGGLVMVAAGPVLTLSAVVFQMPF